MRCLESVLVYMLPPLDKTGHEGSVWRIVKRSRAKLNRNLASEIVDL